MKIKNKTKNSCNDLLLPKQVCYIRFKKTKEKYLCSVDEVKLGKNNIPLITNRNEIIILHFNEKEKLIGIELLSSKEVRKPCME